MPLAIKFPVDNTYLCEDGTKGQDQVKTFAGHEAREAERTANQCAFADEQWTIVEYVR